MYFQKRNAGREITPSPVAWPYRDGAVPTARESPTRIWERAGALGLWPTTREEREMDKEIRERIERLSAEARALFWEVEQQGEEAEFEVPADELVDKLHQRMLELPPEDQVEFVELFRAIGRKAHEEGLRLEVEGIVLLMYLAGGPGSTGGYVASESGRSR